MQGNLFFLTGDNSFEVLRELRRWKREFALKYGEQGDISVLRGPLLSLQELLDLASTPPLFSPKRLIVVEELPTLEKTGFQEILKSIHPQTILLFVASAADRRSALVKALFKNATVRRFAIPTESKLKTWIREEAHGLGMALTDGSIQTLIDVVGTDQWHLHWEIKKLASLASSSPSSDDIRTICLPGGTQAVWHLSGILAKGDRKGALRYLRQLLQRGESPEKLWNIFLWMVRQALSFCIFEEGSGKAGGCRPRMPNPRHQAQACLPDRQALVRGRPQPFQKLAERFSRRGSLAVAERFLEIDEALKSGRIRGSDEHPEEILAVLEREIVEMTS